MCGAFCYELSAFFFLHFTTTHSSSAASRFRLQLFAPLRKSLSFVVIERAVIVHAALMAQVNS